MTRERCCGGVCLCARRAARALQADGGVPGHAAEWRQSAYGRFHRVDFADDDVHAFEELEVAFAPLVERFFRDGERGSRVYRSELQLLTATPTHCDAVNREQTWHADNQARGLTIIIPLIDFCAANGATQLLSLQLFGIFFASLGSAIGFFAASLSRASDPRRAAPAVGGVAHELRPRRASWGTQQVTTCR